MKQTKTANTEQEETDMDLVKMIKRLRIKLRMSQKEFGDLFGVTTTAVSLWETGQREAPYKVLEYVFGFSVIVEETVCKACDGSGKSFRLIPRPKDILINSDTQ